MSNLCKEAAMLALKRGFGSGVQEKVGHSDFIAAMAGIRPSAMREILVDIPKVKWEGSLCFGIGNQKSPVLIRRLRRYWRLRGR